jgi:hypothetical protein
VKRSKSWITSSATGPGPRARVGWPIADRRAIAGADEDVAGVGAAYTSTKYTCARDGKPDTITAFRLCHDELLSPSRRLDSDLPRAASLDTPSWLALDAPGLEADCQPNPGGSVTELLDRMGTS